MKDVSTTMIGLLMIQLRRNGSTQTMFKFTIPHMLRKENAQSTSEKQRVAVIAYTCMMEKKPTLANFKKKHRKNCECCPGHYLSTSVY